MTKNEIYELMKHNPGFHMATCEEDQPRVRSMLLYKADESGIIFHTGTFKDVYKQVVKNPKVELCFNDLKRNIQVRVRGELEIVNDNALKEEISENPSRKFLKPWKESGSLQDFYNSFIIFRLKNGKALIWTIETNSAPRMEIQL
jgi:uncharacterized pyridoxamine 5'-phosphate oxidase family protein